MENSIEQKELLEKRNTVEKDEIEKEGNGKPKEENPVMAFLITTLNGMAYGLFATLIIGTIIATLGSLFPHDEAANGFSLFMYKILAAKETDGFSNIGVAYCLQYLTGAGIGAGIAVALKKKPLEVIVLSAVGEIAGFFSLSTKFVTDGVINYGKFAIGDPLTIYLTVIATVLLMKVVLKRKTPVDILLIPFFGVASALVFSLLLRFPAIYVTFGIQYIVDKATLAVPFIMGIAVSVLMGMALTAPISSAAIAAMVFVTSESSGDGLALASGAAVIGCCCQTIGFAIQSRHDNNIGMVISIAIGTSMLQFKNILKKPIVWLPTILASAILGPVSTCLVKIKCMGSSAGMGTSGLVGQIGTFASMGNTWQTWVGIFVLEIILPLILVFLFDFLFRKLGWIKKGDLKV